MERLVKLEQLIRYAEAVTVSTLGKHERAGTLASLLELQGFSRAVTYGKTDEVIRSIRKNPVFRKLVLWEQGVPRWRAARLFQNHIDEAPLELARWELSDVVSRGLSVQRRNQAL